MQRFGRSVDIQHDSRYVEYPSRADADEAIRVLSSTPLKGVPVTLEDAVSVRCQVSFTLR